MRTRRTFHLKRGFTLVELLVAMTITVMIIGALVSITAIAVETWNRSRSELRAARQAKAMVDALTNDLQSLVVRKGNDNEWLSVKQKTTVGDGSSTSGANLVFFTAATDRYNGQIGSSADDGGDVSCVGYELVWKDPIPSPSAKTYETFVLNRLLINPDKTFDEMLGETEIGERFFTRYSTELEDEQNFVCENVFQFSMTFHVETNTGGVVTNKQISIGSDTGTMESISIQGSKIVTDPPDTTIESGRVTAVGISLTVLSDGGVNQLRANPNLADDPDKFAKWLAKNSFQYSKLIKLPGM